MNCKRTTPQSCFPSICNCLALATVFLWLFGSSFALGQYDLLSAGLLSIVLLQCLGLIVALLVFDLMPATRRGVAEAEIVGGASLGGSVLCLAQIALLNPSNYDVLIPVTVPLVSFCAAAVLLSLYFSLRATTKKAMAITVAVAIFAAIAADMIIQSTAPCILQVVYIVAPLLSCELLLLPGLSRSYTPILWEPGVRLFLESEKDPGAASSAPARAGGGPSTEKSTSAEVEGSPAQPETDPESPRDQRLRRMDEYGLSEREKEVVGLILEGHTRASAAALLFLSERTVKFHIENAYKKMGVHSKAELIQALSRDDTPNPSPQTG